MVVGGGEGRQHSTRKRLKVKDVDQLQPVMSRGQFFYPLRIATDSKREREIKRERGGTGTGTAADSCPHEGLLLPQ